MSNLAHEHGSKGMGSTVATVLWFTIEIYVLRSAPCAFRLG
jgi:hypothetical protein